MTGTEPLPRPQLNAAYYRRRAQESRDLADTMPDAAIRDQIRRIAEGYDRLAELAEAWERNHPTSNR